MEKRKKKLAVWKLYDDVIESLKTEALERGFSSPAALLNVILTERYNK